MHDFKCISSKLKQTKLIRIMFPCSNESKILLNWKPTKISQQASHVEKNLSHGLWELKITRSPRTLKFSVQLIGCFRTRIRIHQPEGDSDAIFDIWSRAKVHLFENEASLSIMMFLRDNRVKFTK